MYRFGHVASAIGIPESQLRNWLTRSKLDLFRLRPEQGWRSFEAPDVAVLSIATELTRYGLRFDEAIDVTHKCLEPDELREPSKLPRTLFASRSVHGGWVMAADEQRAYALGAVNASMLRLSPAIIVRDALFRLPTEQTVAAVASSSNLEAADGAGARVG